MQTTYRPSSRNVKGVWIVASVIYVYWFILLLRSPAPSFNVLVALTALGVVCFFTPVVLSFFVYVSIDGRVISIPYCVFFRKSISIDTINRLSYRSNGLGFFRGTTIQYKTDGSAKDKYARLPSFTTFGAKKSGQMIRLLLETNPKIDLDIKLAKLLKNR